MNLPIKTLDQYQANIIARFGPMPTLAELARRESAAMRKYLGLSPMARPQNSHAPIAEYERGGANVAIVVGVLTRPMTQREVIVASGLCKTTVQKAMNRALEAGMETIRAVADGVTQPGFFGEVR